MSKLAKNTAIYAIGDIVPKLLNLITFPVLTSNLSTADFGIINYINSIEAFLTIFTFLGLKTYYLVHYYKVKTEEDKKKLLGNLSIFIVAFNILVTSIMMICGSQIFAAIGGDDITFYPYISLGVLCNFFSILAVLPGALYRVQENPLPLTIINAIKGLLIMILTCIFVIKEPSAITVLNIKLIITAIFGVLFLYITSKNAILKFDLNQIKLALAFSLPLIPGDAAYYLSSMSDRILIEKYISAESLGVYSMAATLTGMLNILAYGAYKAFEPFFFKTYGTPSFVTNFKKVRELLLYILLPLGLCLAAYSKEVIRLFSTSGYFEAYQYVPALTLGVILSAISCMYSTILTVESKTKTCAAISIICAGLSVFINVILLPKIGIWAAAIANIVIYLVTLYASKYFVNFKVKSIKSVISVLLFIIFVFITNFLISVDNIMMSLLYKSIFVITYLIILSAMFRITPLRVVNLLVKK